MLSRRRKVEYGRLMDIEMKMGKEMEIKRGRKEV